MLARLRRYTPHMILTALSACRLIRRAPDPATRDAIEALYANPPGPPKGPVPVYFIGHSLMGLQGKHGWLGWGARQRTVKYASGASPLR